ncbi:transcription-repair coupling factor [Pseudomonas aeruginosa]|nr:transcription-repair coupling factor [Pseudomonas aeruginosa]
MPVSVLRLPNLPAAAGKQHWGNLPGAALSLAIAEAASSARRFTLLLTADSQNAERLEQELRFFAPDLPVLHFPDWETLPYDVFSPHQDIISQRIAALYQLPQLRHGVLVVPISTALHRLAPTRFLLGSSLVLDIGPETRRRADAPAPGRRRLPLCRYRLRTRRVRRSRRADRPVPDGQRAALPYRSVR